jgi:hypothetical protein
VSERPPERLALIWVLFAAVLLADLGRWSGRKARRGAGFGLLFFLAWLLGCPCARCCPRSDWYGRLCARLVRLAGEQLPAELRRFA